jgi:hypothetical protein
MIIDCHCHAGKGDRMTAPWNTDAVIEPYLRRAHHEGIDKTIVVSIFHSDYNKANAEVARIIARHPGRLIGFVYVHATRDAGRIFQMVANAVRKWRFRGIKVHGYEAMPTREVCEVARAFRLPIFIDVISRPEVIDMLAPPTGGLSDRPLSQRLRRYFDRPPLRLHRRGCQAGGTA